MAGAAVYTPLRQSHIRCARLPEGVPQYPRSSFVCRRMEAGDRSSNRFARTMKGWRRWLIIIGSVVLVIVLLQATVLRPRPIEVDVARAQRGTVEDAVANSQAGTVKSRFRAN